MLEVFKWHLPDSCDRVLHVGVMTSYKKINGVKTRYATAFPDKELFAGIFGSSDVMNCLHYVDYDNMPGLADNLSRAIFYGGTGINALQLDMVWPAPGEIAQAVHIARKKIEVILQIGELAFERVDNNPQNLLRKLEDYDGVIHRVLLDKSMGKGLSMNAEALLPYALAIKERFPDLKLVAAGGLGPDSVGLIEPVLRAIPDISWDAQGKLRPSGDALDPIDWDMSANYLIRSLEQLQTVSCNPSSS